MLLPENQQETASEAISSQTEVADLTFRNDVLTVKVKENAEMSVQQMSTLLGEAVKIAGHKKYFAIIDVRAAFHSEADVREYYSDNEYSGYRYADAFVVKSLAIRLLVNFYISFNKPSIPTKTFTEPEQAAKWIAEMKQRLN